MQKRQKAVFIAVCTVPSLLLFGIFFLYPMIKAFIMGFFRWSGLTSGTGIFIGFDNFKAIFEDPVVVISLKNTFSLMLVVPLVTMSISMFFAVMLTRKKFGEKNFYRTVFFFPNVLSAVVIAILWTFIYSPTLGILNSFLDKIGLAGLEHAWLGENATALWAVAVTSIWASIGYYMVLYIAAIENIPAELYEAATIDGAGEFKQFAYITLPLMWEVVRVTIIFFISDVFYGSFNYIKVMTNGGPDRASEVLSSYMYNQAFTNANVGYATALGIIIFLIGLAMSLISNKITKRDVVEF